MANDNLDQQPAEPNETATSVALADPAAVDPLSSTTTTRPGATWMENATEGDTNNGDGKAALVNATKRHLLYTRYALDNEDQDHSHGNNTEGNNEKKKMISGATTGRERLYTRYALDNEDQEKKTASPNNEAAVPGVTWMEHYDADQMAAMDVAAAAQSSSPQPGAVSVQGATSSVKGGGKGDRLRGYYMDNDSSGNHQDNPEQEKKVATSKLGKVSRYWREADDSSSHNYHDNLNNPNPVDENVPAEHDDDHQRRETNNNPVQRDPQLDNDILAGVAPLPLQRGPTHRDRRMDQSNPGAHRAGFNHVHNSDEFDSRDFNNNSRHLSAEMAVANLVEEDLEQQNLPQAVPDSLRAGEDVHHNSLATMRERERKRQLLCKGGIAITVLVAVLVIVLTVLLVPNAEKDDYDLYHLQPTFQPSSSPTNAPTSLESYALSLLPPYTLQAMEIDQESPQAQAFRWLMEDSLYNPNLNDQRLIQRYSLATLYFATGGEQWLENTHWMEHNVSECNWHSLIDSPLFRSPPTCNTNGTFEHLGLQKNNLVNAMPLELFLLTNLKTLNLGLNRMQGPLPTHLGQLTDLQGLWIFHLKNGGRIPSQLGKLTDLQAISLVQNLHTGTLPTQIGLLSSMMSLFLGGSPGITGPLPNTTAMKDLWYLHVDQNSHTGTIPTQIGKLKGLTGLMVGGNNLHGTIPTQIGRAKSLAFLSTYENQFTGTLPTELGLLTRTTLMTFNDLQLTGTIPSQIGRLTGIWQKLAFDGNPKLTGSLPTQLGRLTILEYLSVANNNHTGPIPSQLGVLPMIGRLDLSNNSMTGTMPVELEELQNRLFYLDIQGNPLLSGTVPESLCDLTGQCVMYSWSFLEPCPKENFFAHDCTEMLCGCDCACGRGIDAGGNDTVATEVGDRGSSSTLLTILEEEP